MNFFIFIVVVVVIIIIVKALSGARKTPQEREREALKSRKEGLVFRLKVLGGANCSNCTPSPGMCPSPHSPHSQGVCMYYRGDKATDMIDEQNKLVKDYMDFNAKWR